MQKLTNSQLQNFLHAEKALQETALYAIERATLEYKVGMINGHERAELNAMWRLAISTSQHRETVLKKIAFGLLPQSSNAAQQVIRSLQTNR